MLVYSTGIPTPDREDYPIVCWENIVPESSVSATNTVAGFPSSNAANPSMSEYWEADIDGQGADLTFSFAARNVDYVAVFMPRKLNELLGEDDNNVFVNYHNGTSWLSVSIPLGNIRNVGNVLIVHFAEANIEQLRLRFNYYGDAATQNLQVSNVYIGSILKLPRKMYVGFSPPSLNLKTRAVSNKSESGMFLGRVIRSTKVGGTVSQQNIDPQLYRDEIEPFARSCRENPFFMAWRPTSYPQETNFCWLTSDVQVGNQLPNGMVEFSFDFGAYYDGD